MERAYTSSTLTGEEEIRYQPPRECGYELLSMGNADPVELEITFGPNMKGYITFHDADDELVSQLDNIIWSIEDGRVYQGHSREYYFQLDRRTLEISSYPGYERRLVIPVCKDLHRVLTDIAGVFDPNTPMEEESSAMED